MDLLKSVLTIPNSPRDCDNQKLPNVHCEAIMCSSESLCLSPSKNHLFHKVMQCLDFTLKYIKHKSYYVTFFKIKLTLLLCAFTTNLKLLKPFPKFGPCLPLHFFWGHITFPHIIIFSKCWFFILGLHVTLTFLRMFLRAFILALSQLPLILYHVLAGMLFSQRFSLTSNNRPFWHTRIIICHLSYLLPWYIWLRFSQCANCVIPYTMILFLAKLKDMWGWLPCLLHTLSCAMLGAYHNARHIL
jgi:hypothetical protein